MIYKLHFLRSLLNVEILKETSQEPGKISADTHTVHEFVHEIDLLAALIGAADAQIIDKFKEAFPPEIESKLLDIDDLEI